MKMLSNQYRYKHVILNFSQTYRIYHFQSFLAGVIKGGDIYPRLIQRLCVWAPPLPKPYVKFWIGSALTIGVVLTVKELTTGGEQGR